jgi:shikimate kinase
MMNSLTLLIGHRGVGKTSLLKRIQRYFPETSCYCLDEEIEKKIGPIKDYFTKNGEFAFRDLEQSVFKELLEKSKQIKLPAFIALGGGFSGELPKEARCLWVKRDWDVSQNIFFDRPSLNPDREDLRIPRALFDRREELWREQGYEELTLPEGVYSAHMSEIDFFKNKNVGGAVTLLPDHFKRDRLERLLSLSPAWVELRDDLLSEEQIKNALKLIPKKQTLLSFREVEREKSTLSLVASEVLVDWPLERGQPSELMNPAQIVYSLHSDEESFFDAFETVFGVEGKIKWSPFVKNLQQLKLGHEWMLRKPSDRVFLPRSECGRWYWYRHLQKNKMFLNFWREGFGSSLDQPTLLQWLQPAEQKYFSAVLGQPVLQSWSPAYHADYWSEKNMSMYAIELASEELTKEGFDFLTELGLCAAAVTSPLKNWAAKVVHSPTPLNTLYKNHNSQWQGQSTDAIGFSELLKNARLVLTDKKVVVWGGGGVLASLQLPQASFYSARSGEPREGHPLVPQPDVIIWAAGEPRGAEMPVSWRPSAVVDLNYRADSLAKSYAYKVQAQYYSGDVMFFKQAQEQQKIWSSYEWC